MSTQTLVSTVIATRNRPELLAIAMNAVLDQSYPGPIECILVFDQAEPDLSLERDDPHRSVRVLANTQRTPGLAGARNTGILAAHGEFVAFCDDDDYWRSTKLERQLETLGDALTSVTGITINYGDYQSERIPKQETFTLENLVRSRLMAAHPSSVLMRRDAVIDRIGLVDEELPKSYAEDFDFIIRALQAGPISVVEEPLVEVLWGQSMFSRDWDSIVAAVDYLIAKHEPIRNDRRALARLYGRRSFANAGRGARRESLADIGKALRNWPLEKRAFATLPVTLGLFSAPKLLDLAHKRGHGI